MWIATCWRCRPSCRKARDERAGPCAGAELSGERPGIVPGGGESRVHGSALARGPRAGSVAEARRRRKSHTETRRRKTGMARTIRAMTFFLGGVIARSPRVRADARPEGRLRREGAEKVLAKRDGVRSPYAASQLRRTGARLLDARVKPGHDISKGDWWIAARFQPAAAEPRDAGARQRSGGRVTITVVPRPGSLSISKRPPCCFVSSCTMGRPRPRPPYLRQN